MKKSQSIDDIIFSLKGYGLGDIEHNKSRAISGLILSICFIDQLASLRYPKARTLAVNWERFIDEYMPIYSGKKIYTDLRNSLLHNYSGGGKFAIAYGDETKEEIFKHDDLIVISPSLFIKNLQKAFINFEQDLRANRDNAATNALKWSIKHPVLSSKEI